MQKINKTTIVILLGLLCLIGISINDYFQEEKQRKEQMNRKMRINELWRQYLEKDPNEEELWIIVIERKSFDLMNLASKAVLPIINSEKRLLYLLREHEYNTKLRIKISDRILENPSEKALKKIIEKCPERAESALLALLKIADPNEIGFDCLKDVIINIPSHRKWAWHKILSKLDQIKPSLCWAFNADPNYPEKVANAYFRSNLKPKHYKEMIFYLPYLSDRAFKEFLATKPKNEDLREIIVGNRWNKHVKKKKKMKVEAAKYILANSPLKGELDQIKKNCPSLRKEIQAIKKKNAEQKIIPKTKKEILRAIEKVSY